MKISMNFRNQNMHVVDTTSKYYRTDLPDAKRDAILHRLKETAVAFLCLTDLSHAELSKTFRRTRTSSSPRTTTNSSSARLPAPRTVRH